MAFGTLSLDGSGWTVYPLLPNVWRAKQVWRADPAEAAAGRVPAGVPGHAQSALLAAGALPHPYQGENSRLWEWTSERDWVYAREFELPAEWAGSRLWLRFEGIDGAAHVFLNGELAGEHDASFVPACFEVSPLARSGETNRLCVVVERAPDVQGQTGWTSRERHWRARFAYGWDFAARLAPVGIWDSVCLQATGPAAFRQVALYSNLATDRSEAALSIVSEFEAGERTPAVVTAQVLFGGLPVAEAQDPITIFQDDTSLVQSLRVPRVQLWWPNGAGTAQRAPALYEARVTIQDMDGSVLDQRVFQFGVRSLEMVENEGAPPDSLPYTLVVNGQRLFKIGRAHV